jgi:uncharacterized protein YxjI
MLELDTILVKERVGMLKISDTYDLLDPSTGNPVGLCKEHIAWWVHILRLVVNKRMLPTVVRITDQHEARTFLEIRRGFSFLSPRVSVVDGQGKVLGHLKSKLFSWGINFRILDVAEQEIASVKGDWKGWNFQLLAASGDILGTITKKWAGLGKELFTSADNYVVDLSGSANKTASRKMLLAAALAIDTCFKEGA